MEIKISKLNIKKFFFNNKLIFLFLFISILLYSNAYSNSLTPLEILLSNLVDASSKDLELLLGIINVFKITSVQVSINLTTIILSIYLISLLLLITTKIDIKLSKKSYKIYYYEIVDAYFKSLYIIIADFLFKAIYIYFFKSYELNILSASYGLIINFIQCFLILNSLNHKKNKLIFTKVLYILSIIALFAFQLFVLI